MPDKMLDLSTTTNEYEENMQTERTNFPNKIKLRPESFEHVVSNIVNFPVRNNTITDIKAEETKTDSRYNLIQIPNRPEKISESKAIKLKQEKLIAMKDNLNLNDKTEEIFNDSEELMDVEEKVEAVELPTLEETMVLDNISENIENNDIMELENNNELDFAETKEVEVENVENKEEITVNEVDELYQQISQETKDTLKIKEDALKAQKRIQEFETTAKQELDDSNQRLQEKSAEQAGVQAKKEDALKRKSEVEQKIAETFARQKKALKQAKENYLSIISSAETRELELRESVMKQTEANESKIIQFQESIDRDTSVITEVEEEIARKEAVLKALSGSVGIGLANDAVAMSMGQEIQNEEEPVYRKVA